MVRPDSPRAGTPALVAPLISYSPRPPLVRLEILSIRHPASVYAQAAKSFSALLLVFGSAAEGLKGL